MGWPIRPSAARPVIGHGIIFHQITTCVAEGSWNAIGLAMGQAARKQLQSCHLGWLQSTAPRFHLGGAGAHWQSISLAWAKSWTQSLASPVVNTRQKVIRKSSVWDPGEPLPVWADNIGLDGLTAEGRLMCILFPHVNVWNCLELSETTGLSRTVLSTLTGTVSPENWVKSLQELQHDPDNDSGIFRSVKQMLYHWGTAPPHNMNLPYV